MLLDQICRQIYRNLPESWANSRPVLRALEAWPPRSSWKVERQTHPPTFGWAKRLNDFELERTRLERKSFCEEVLQSAKSFCSFEPGKISLVILSCKRWPTLQRLIQSLERHHREIEPISHLERILVDNGSGKELIERARATGFFTRIIDFPTNLGMVNALRRAYEDLKGEYVLFLEDDFVIDTPYPFLGRCLDLFREDSEVGIIRLKNQNNWWKPYRRISHLQTTPRGTKYWIWAPSADGSLNGWAAGSVLFRKVSYFSVGRLEEVKGNPTRDKKFHQGYLYECEYGRKFNRRWLAAKIQHGCPFIQPNDNEPCEGWGES